MLDILLGGFGRKDHRSTGYRYDEDDSDVEEFYESRRSHHRDNHAQPNHNVSRFVGDVAETVVTPLEIAAKMVVNPVHNLLFSSPKGEKGNGRHGRHEDANYGRMQHHGGQRMQHHGGQRMQYDGEQRMQHHGGHGMQHYNGHEMQHHGEGRMKNQDRLMAPQVPPHHDYMNPSYDSGSGRAVMMQASESWRVTTKADKGF